MKFHGVGFGIRIHKFNSEIMTIFKSINNILRFLIKDFKFKDIIINQNIIIIIFNYMNKHKNINKLFILININK